MQMIWQTLTRTETHFEPTLSVDIVRREKEPTSPYALKLNVSSICPLGRRSRLAVGRVD